MSKDNEEMITISKAKMQAVAEMCKRNADISKHTVLFIKNTLRDLKSMEASFNTMLGVMTKHSESIIKAGKIFVQNPPAKKAQKKSSNKTVTKGKNK